MSAAESDEEPRSGEAAAKEPKKPAPAPARASDEETSFVEGNHQTVMTYGHGGFPKYIMAIWVAFLVGYAIYFYVYGLPDLTAWGSP